jgi:hypothetical protein
MGLRASRHTTTPTDRRILAKNIYDFLSLGPEAISQGRGVEKPKGMEQMEIVARGRRSNRRDSRPYRVNLRHRGTPRATMKCGGFFFLVVSPIT